MTKIWESDFGEVFDSEEEARDNAWENIEEADFENWLLEHRTAVDIYAKAERVRGSMTCCELFEEEWSEAVDSFFNEYYHVREIEDEDEEEDE